MKKDINILPMNYKKYKQYRLTGHDYSSEGDYFITICTKDRLHHFGKIIKNNEGVTMEFTPVGSFVNESILSIPGTYKDVTLGETVVMPNHIHLILHLPFKALSPQYPAPKKGLNPLVPCSVSSIINHLKGKVKKWANTNGFSSFAWQAKFHDHIIRDSKSYNRISNYIVNNVWNWENDQNNV